MKITTYLLLVLLTTSLHSQTPGLTASKPTAPTSPPIAPNEPSAVPVPAPSTKAAGAAPRTNWTKNKRTEAVNLDVESAGRAAEKTARLLEADSLLPRTVKTGRTLVVQSAETDATALANAEEDMSVMGLILRKATGGSRAEDRRLALGIEVDSTVFGSSSGARNIYLENYGALFLLGVRYPLLPPTDKSEEKEPKENVSDDWAGAREEYLSSGAAGQNSFQVTLEQTFTAGTRGPVEEYDADKVEELKATLLQALKNGSHIRSLKPSDYITVVIQGADGGHITKVVKGNNNRARLDLRRGETVMTLRVRKQEVDAFAKGDLDLEAFRKKVAMQVYARRGDAAVGTSGFSTTR